MEKMKQTEDDPIQELRERIIHWENEGRIIEAQKSFIKYIEYLAGANFDGILVKEQKNGPPHYWTHDGNAHELFDHAIRSLIDAGVLKREIAEPTIHDDADYVIKPSIPSRDRHEYSLVVSGNNKVKPHYRRK